MNETALGATLRAVGAALTAGPELWGQSVYLGVAPAGTNRPYVVMQRMDDRELNLVRGLDASVLLAVKCVSESMATAMAGRARIQTLLNDRGAQEVASGGLDAGPEWVITTVTTETGIHFSEWVDGQEIFHCGSQFRIRLAGS